MSEGDRVGVRMLSRGYRTIMECPDRMRFSTRTVVSARASGPVLVGALVGLLLALLCAGAAAAAPSWRVVSTLETETTGPGHTLAQLASSIVALPDGGYVIAEGYPAFIGGARYTADGTSVGPATGVGLYLAPGGPFLSYGAGVASDGSILVTDVLSHQVHRYVNGQHMGVWGQNGAADGELNGPFGVAGAPDGTVLIVDSGNNRVQRFTVTGTHVATYGTAGAADGEFSNPRTVAVNPDGSFLIVDAGNNRVQKFAADGTFQLAFGASGVGDGEFSDPVGIAVTATGEALVSDVLQHRVQRFSSAGAFVDAFGSPGAGPGQFQGPASVAVLTDGRILVGDSSYRVSVFAADGTYQATRHQPLTSGKDFRAIVDMVSVPGSTDMYVVKHDPTGIAPSPFRCTTAFVCTLFGTTGVDYNAVLGVAALSNGDMLITADPGIKRFSPSGVNLGTFGPVGYGAGEVGGATVLDVAPDGTVWVAEGDGVITHLAADGTYLGEFPTPGGWILVRELDVRADGTILLVGHSPTLAEVRLVTTAGAPVWTQTADSTDRLGSTGTYDLGDGTFLIGGNTVTQRRYSDGSVVRRMELPASAYTPHVDAFAAAPNGRVFAADVGNSRMLEIELYDPPITVSPTQDPPSSVGGSSSGSAVLTFAVEGATGSVSFTATFGGSSVTVGSDGRLPLASLPEGRSTLRVVAVDADGRTAVWEQVLVVDRTAPTLRSVPRYTTRSFATVQVADEVAGVNQTRRSVRLPSTGRRTVRMRVTDTVGNTAVRTFTIERRSSLVDGDWNRGIELWRPGGTFTPGDSVLRAVFGRNAVRQTPYSPAMVREVQFRLKKLGRLSRIVRSSGTLDPATRAALKSFQRSRGLAQSGVPDRATRRSLDGVLTSLT